MPAFIAMLRGINVSGHKPVKMDRLRASFEALGYTAVKTYIQSGNVLFTAANKPDRELAAKIERKILDDFGFEVPVLIRSAKELDGVLQGNPLAGKQEMDEMRLYVTFLSGQAPATAEASLKPLAAKAEQFFVRGREIYFFCPHGYGQTKFSNAAFEKKLGLQATTRNWRTVNVLAGMMRE